MTLKPKFDKDTIRKKQINLNMNINAAQQKNYRK